MGFTLKYVCKWCGVTVGEFPQVKSHEPATFSVCDKPECRRQASAAYRASAA